MAKREVILPYGDRTIGGYKRKDSNKVMPRVAWAKETIGTSGYSKQPKAP